ncbi:hypothetical protein BC941DRAFT_441328 [Chlamydoabsidia padenii]|nr:hypothetical protein BC941DRAFT_441328 [Chlamydoabsidia padenii]
MSATDDIAGESRKWSEIVAKGQKMKVPTTTFRKNKDQNDKMATASVVIFERDDLAAQMKLHRAEMILQQALNPDTVLFEFPGTADLGNEGTTYKLIEKQLGLAIGFRTVSHPNKNRRGNIIIEAKLMEEGHDKALTEGLTINGVKYLGTPTNSTEEDYPEMVKIHVSGVPLALPDEIKEGLLESMSIYGKVCQIRMEKRWGYFEGNATILLDRKASQAGMAYEPLQRMLFLQAWERYVPAQYKGAPPICFHCRQSDHMKKDCPVLAQVKCYGCRGKGHIARHCPMTRRHESDSDGESDDKPEPKKQKTVLVRKNSLSITETLLEKEVEVIDKANEHRDEHPESVEDTKETPSDQIQDDNVMMEEIKAMKDTGDMEIMDCEETGKLAIDPRNSTQASKYAPANLARQMPVDSPKEMMALSTSRTPRRKTIIESRQSSKIPQYWR